MNNKKKIGLLTLALHENYGGILQAFALQKFITDLGYETVFINRQPNRIRYSDIKKPPIIKELTFIKRLWNDFDNRQRIYKDSSAIENFISRYFVPRTETIVEDDGMKPLISKYNLGAIVVGSDQVWQPRYSGSYTKNLFLDFSSGVDIQRLTYAASFGGNVWDYPPVKTLELSALLKRFNGVSVRESSGVQLCKQTFDVVPVQLVDPTLLLPREDYETLIGDDDQIFLEKQPFLLTYILDPSKEITSIVDKVARERNLKVVSIGCMVEANGKTFYGKPKTKKIYPPISQWLSSFKNADFIITDSFHGVVFSNIFKRSFLAIGNRERGLDRFESLLKLLGLPDRLIFKDTIVTKQLVESKVDFSNIDRIVQNERNRSKDYLNEHLKK